MSKPEIMDEEATNPGPTRKHKAKPTEPIEVIADDKKVAEERKELLETHELVYGIWKKRKAPKSS